MGGPSKAPSKADQPAPGDEQQGTWPRDLLIKMDADFCHALERAIASGRENLPHRSEPTDHHRW